MKRYYFLIVIVLLCANPVLAQDCYEKTRSKGIGAYNNGKYKEAKEYFDFAKSCDDKPANNDLQARIDMCDKKIAEVADAEKRRQEEAARKAREAEEQKARQEEEQRKRKAEADERKRQKEQEERRTGQEVIPEPPINLNPPPKPQTTLSVSKNDLSFDASGEQEFIDVSTNESNWYVSEKIAWCHITTPTDSSIRLVCQVNTDDWPRNDYFYIVAGEKQVRINIRQEVAKDPVALGNELYKRKKYEDARKLYVTASVKGNAEAPYRLGKMYLEGSGVEKNRSTAMTFFQKSAAYQYSRGENAVGYMYETQDNPNYKEAAYWYMKSARNGYVFAQYNLGLMYQYGFGVKKNEKEAQKWFQKSAAQGFVKAKNELE
jgi:TPR repeat protein